MAIISTGSVPKALWPKFLGRYMATYIDNSLNSGEALTQTKARVILS